MIQAARRCKFKPNVLEQIFTRFRTLRQQLLKGANENPWRYPIHFLILQVEAYMLLIDMKEMFLELYAESGDENLFELISQTRFASADPGYIPLLLQCREDFLQADTVWKANYDAEHSRIALSTDRATFD